VAKGGSPIGHVMPITRSRVPVVRTKIRSVGVDVVFGQRNGMAAAKWTHDTVDAEARDRGSGEEKQPPPPRLPALVRVVKAFLRQNDANDVSKGGLGSHALTVAIAGYLQHARRRRRGGGTRGGGDGGGRAESARERAEKEDGEVEGNEEGEEEEEEEERDLGALLVGFMTTFGSLDITRRCVVGDGFGPKPVEWMTASELAEVGSEPTAAMPPVAEPPRLGVEDPLCKGRNLAVSSHKIARALAALGAAGESLKQAGLLHHSRGVRLVSWTILAVTAVICWCFGCRSLVSGCLHGPYRLSSIEPCFDCKLTW
jgi:non-canonical poly(A) RNA polymerase PAPD5/7